jgi:hypothetical protein
MHRFSRTPEDALDGSRNGVVQRDPKASFKREFHKRPFIRAKWSLNESRLEVDRASR